LTVVDVDGGANPTRALVEILSPVAGDTLHFTNQNGIAGLLAVVASATLAVPATHASFPGRDGVIAFERQGVAR
jgi:hypothetical protein